TSEMKNLHSLYESQRGIDPRSAYIFWFTQKSESSERLLGDMPLESRYGYVFSKALDQHAYHTIAHELGHGVFSLRHTFSKDYAIAQGSTRNLMDYPTAKTTNATELKKYQWDALHDPKKLIAPWMQNEEEGEMRVPCLGWLDECKDVAKILESIREARVKGNNLRFKMQKSNEEKIFTAYFLQIQDVEYKKIRLIYNPLSEDVIINPSEYEEYNQQFLQADGSTDWQRGFAFYHKNTILFKILIDDYSKKEDLKDYLFGKDYDYIKNILDKKDELTPQEIKDIRSKIKELTDTEQKKELYLELQTKVPYHNQRNNEQTQYIADRMCNLTSQAMCLEYLGLSCPDSNMQFEDYLEQMREDNNYGARTTQTARQKIAENLNVYYSKEDY